MAVAACGDWPRHFVVTTGSVLLSALTSLQPGQFVEIDGAVREAVWHLPLASAADRLEDGAGI